MNKDLKQKPLFVCMYVCEFNIVAIPFLGVMMRVQRDIHIHKVDLLQLSSACATVLYFISNRRELLVRINI